MTPKARAELHALFCRLADGDRDAVEPAFALVAPALRELTGRALGDGAQADDAAQQAAVTLFEQVGAFDPSRDALGWALTIASFEVRSIRRRAQRRREEPLDGASHVASDGRDAEAALVERDLARAARALLVDLKDEDARVILAALADERAAGATFRKRLQRALARWREAWRAKHGTP